MSTVAEFIRRVEAYARPPAQGLDDRIFWAYNEAWQEVRRQALTAHTLAILQAHVDRDCSQVRLSQRLGFSPSYLSQLLSGKKPITMEFAERVNATLGPSVSLVVGELNRAEWLAAARMQTIHYVATQELATVPTKEELSREAYECVRAFAQHNGPSTMNTRYYQELLGRVHALPEVPTRAIKASGFEAVLEKWYVPYVHVNRVFAEEATR